MSTEHAIHSPDYPDERSHNNEITTKMLAKINKNEQINYTALQTFPYYCSFYPSG